MHNFHLNCEFLVFVRIGSLLKSNSQDPHQMIIQKKGKSMPQFIWKISFETSKSVCRQVGFRGEVAEWGLVFRSTNLQEVHSQYMKRKCFQTDSSCRSFQTEERKIYRQTMVWQGSTLLSFLYFRFYFCPKKIDMEPQSCDGSSEVLRKNDESFRWQTAVKTNQSL